MTAEEKDALGVSTLRVDLAERVSLSANRATERGELKMMASRRGNSQLPPSFEFPLQ